MAKHHPVTIEDYMALPYTEIVAPDEEEGGFVARVLELPGCLADGDTRAEALEELQEAKLSWLASALEAHDPIPLPLERGEYNGKVLVRMTRRLHHDLAVRAAFEGVSLNQLCVTLLSQGLASSAVWRATTDFLSTLGDPWGSGAAQGEVADELARLARALFAGRPLRGEHWPSLQTRGHDQTAGNEADASSRAPVE